MADLFDDPASINPADIVEAEYTITETIEARVTGPKVLVDELSADFLQTSDDNEENPPIDCDCGNCFQCMIEELAQSDSYPIDPDDHDPEDFELIDCLLELEDEDGDL